MLGYLVTVGVFLVIYRRRSLTRGPLGPILGPLGPILGSSWAFLVLSWAYLCSFWVYVGLSSASSLNLGLCGRYRWAPSVFRSYARNLSLGCFGHVLTRLEPLPSIMGYVVAVLGLFNPARRNARSD